ncbi:MAG: TIGR03546 family protein [Elusimicrobia bacterium]|nr:TIGR03546 family protein [Elusimicrobiota bacterium]
MPLLRPLRYLAKALVAVDSPRQLAAGLALGFALGLIPKTSLLATLGLVVLAALQVNLAAAYGAAALASLFSSLADPLAHAVGHALLVKAAFLAPLWTALYNLPVVPWTGFNNTVTLGWTVLGALLAYPIYRAAVPWCERYRESIGARLRQYKVVQLLLGADLGSKAAGS